MLGFDVEDTRGGLGYTEPFLAMERCPSQAQERDFYCRSAVGRAATGGRENGVLNYSTAPT